MFKMNFSTFNTIKTYQYKTANMNSRYIDETINNPVIKILIIILIILIACGLMGNILNLIVFSSKNMKRISTFRFLRYLSASDLLVLLIASTDAVLKFGFQFEIRLYSTSLCRLHTFFTYFLTHTSSIILMAVSIDRALVINNKTISSLFRGKKKRKRSLISNKVSRSVFCFNSRRIHRVDLVFLLIVFILALLNFHYILFIDLNTVLEENIIESTLDNYVVTFRNGSNFLEPKHLIILSNDNRTNLMAMNRSNPFFFINYEIFHICFPLENTSYYYFLNNIWIWIDITVYALIPFVVMSICSAIILFNIDKKSKRFFRRLLDKRNIINRAFIYKRIKRNRQLLYMLLITNLFFICSILPCCVAFLLFHGSKSESVLFQLSVHILLYTNNSINFLLYGISSQKFRQQLSKMFFASKRKKSSNNQLRLMNNENYIIRYNTNMINNNNNNSNNSNNSNSDKARRNNIKHVKININLKKFNEDTSTLSNKQIDAV